MESNWKLFALMVGAVIVGGAILGRFAVDQAQGEFWSFLRANKPDLST